MEVEANYGTIEEMNVCDNLGDHLVGNVYIKVREREGEGGCRIVCVSFTSFTFAYITLPLTCVHTPSLSLFP